MCLKLSFESVETSVEAEPLTILPNPVCHRRPTRSSPVSVPYISILATLSSTPPTPIHVFPTHGQHPRRCATATQCAVATQCQKQRLGASARVTGLINLSSAISMFIVCITALRPRRGIYLLILFTLLQYTIDIDWLSIVSCTRKTSRPLYSLQVAKSSRFRQQHGLQSTTLTFFYKNIY